MSLYRILSLIAPRLSEEKAAALQQCEESIAEKAEETTKIKLQLEETQQELLLTKNQVRFAIGNVCVLCCTEIHVFLISPPNVSDQLDGPVAEGPGAVWSRAAETKQEDV